MGRGASRLARRNRPPAQPQGWPQNLTGQATPPQGSDARARSVVLRGPCHPRGCGATGSPSWFCELPYQSADDCAEELGHAFFDTLKPRPSSSDDPRRSSDWLPRRRIARRARPSKSKSSLPAPARNDWAASRATSSAWTIVRCRSSCAVPDRDRTMRGNPSDRKRRIPNAGGASGPSGPIAIAVSAAS